MEKHVVFNYKPFLFMSLCSFLSLYQCLPVKDSSVIIFIDVKKYTVILKL